MKVSDFIVQELIRNGVEVVFSLPGGFSQYLNDSFHYSSIKVIYMLHESGCAFAASAYAQYTGKIGVCVVTSGPGSTNSLTGVVAAWDDSIPLLVISGEAKLQNINNRREFQLRVGGPQDVPIGEIVKPITKWSSTLINAEILHKDFITNIIKCAMTPRRGPVWFAIPLDIQGMQIE
jgi:acetolactate synthase-1/2/3 large subunit